MNTSLVMTTVLSGCEKLVNAVIAQDSAAQKKIQALSGRILQIYCEQPTLFITIQFVEDQVFLFQGETENPDCSVRGKSTSLIKLLITQNTASMHSEGIEVTGNTGVLSTTQAILGDLDIDWEYQLSQIIGDIPTQLVADSLDLARRFLRTAATSIRDDVSSYLLTEKKVFPEQAELDTFYQGVDQLRLRLDRLNGRLSRLDTTQP